MIFESPRMVLKVVRIVLDSEVNDVYICQNISTEAATMYTVLRIKQHETVHTLLKVFEKSDKKIEDVCVDCFSVDDNFVVVFPYVTERPLSTFFIGRAYTLPECESICVNLVVNMMTATIPYPLLYLILSQGQLNISRDDNIYMGYQIDLSDINDSVGESLCVTECAKIVLKLLETKQNDTDVMSYSLIDKKIYRKSYKAFTELYKDIRIAAAPEKKRNIFTRIRAFFRRNKDSIFKVLLVVAVVCGLFMIIALITNFIFGDIPWLKIFFGSLKQIGTENLVQ